VGAPVDLGDIWRFAVFGSTALTDTAAGSDIIGNVGCYPAVTIPPYTRINGDVFIGDAVALSIQTKTKHVVDIIKIRYQCVTTFASTVELGNRILKQGIYEAATTMTREYDLYVLSRVMHACGIPLTHHCTWWCAVSSGNLMLDAEGDSAAIFILRAGTTVTIATTLQVLLIGGAHANNVYWSAGTVFIVAANSKLVGSVFAPSITFAVGSKLDGRALAYGTTLTMMSTTVCNSHPQPLCVHFCMHIWFLYFVC